MGDEHHGLAERLPEREEIVVEPKPRDLVERRERLVHQQQPRLGHQRARDRGPHLHAARQFARIVDGMARKARRGPTPPRPAGRASVVDPHAASTAAAHCAPPWPRASASAPGRRSRCAAGRRSRPPSCRPSRSSRASARSARRSGASAVDLPQPEGPSSVTNSPGQISRSSRSSATTPVANVLADVVERDDWTACRSRHGADREPSDTLRHNARFRRSGDANRYFRRPASDQERDPPLDFGRVKLGKLLDARARSARTRWRETCPYLRLADRPRRWRCRGSADILRQPRRPIDAEPAREPHAGHAGFGESRHIGNRRQPVGAADRQSLDQARPWICSMTTGNTSMITVDRAAHEIVERGRPAR